MSDSQKPIAWILGGGTVNYVRTHLTLGAIGYGTVAKDLFSRLQAPGADVEGLEPRLILTRMADSRSNIQTSDDLASMVDTIVANPRTKVVFFTCAVADFTGKIGNVESGKYAERMKSRSADLPGMVLEAAPKILKSIRKERKDIFLVAFKATSGATPREQYLAGLNLLKENSCNLVLANDVKTRENMVIVPEEAAYQCDKFWNEDSSRDAALGMLVSMTLRRAGLHYTRSTVNDDVTYPWSGDQVPENLRAVVDHCIRRGAYQRFRGATAGHFAVKTGPTTLLTSKRKSDFNNLANVGLVQLAHVGEDEVFTRGGKPSVGGQSQRIIFAQHEDVDCIVHFHCEKKPESTVKGALQWPYECGSHECGENTSRNLESYGNIKAVHLYNHGPNVVFNRNVPAQEVIDFIEANWDLTQKTGGFNVEERVVAG